MITYLDMSFELGTAQPLLVFPLLLSHLQDKLIGFMQLPVSMLYFCQAKLDERGVQMMDTITIYG